jgi:O-antigen/teichoic acid export membrane protein
MSTANLVAQGLTYVALLVLARLVPPDSWGVVTIGVTLIWMAAVLLDGGTAGSVIVRARLTPASLRRVFWRCLIIALALATIMAVAARGLVAITVRHGDPAVLAVLALSLPLYAISLVPVAVMQRTMQFGRVALITATANVGSTAVAIVAGLVGAGVWALVVRQLLWFGLLALLAGIVARPTLRALADDDRDPGRPQASGDRWFLAFRITLLVALSLDYLVIGNVSDVTDLGLYALAFTIAFAPLQQFSGEVGKVLFAAAAASGRESSRARTLRAVHLMAALLLPLLPVAIVLAPTALPALLGSNWTGMVVPFQLLLVAGIGHAIVNCLGETLSGIGQIAFRAKVNVGWCVATLAAVLVLVKVDGIRGAAIAHLAIFGPLAAVYATAGARRIGTGPRELWRTLRPTLAVVAVQAAVTAALAIGLRGIGSGLAAWAGAAAGLLVVAAVSARDRAGPVREAIAALRRARVREPGSPGR